jgi:hypothetical protein
MTMNKKPRWRDKEGNLYTDKETIGTNGRRHVIGKDIEVFPVGIRKK